MSTSDDFLPPAIDITSPEGILGEFIDVYYREDPAGGWVVVGMAKDRPSDSAEHEVFLGRGETLAAAQAEAVTRALVAYGGFMLVRGIASLFSWLRSRPQDEVESRRIIEVRDFGVGTDTALVTGTGLGGHAVAVPEPTFPKVGPDFGWRIEFDHRSDGGFEWHLCDLEGQMLFSSGEAGSFDDALLALLERMVPPSAEGLAGPSAPEGD